MYGAILGDMIGAPYEFDRSKQKKDFDMFNRYIRYTDDSMMTIAIAEAVMTAGIHADEQTMKTQFVESMQKWGRKYPDAGYGGMFYQWLYASEPEPYGSFGNGSAMRVSSVGWFFDSPLVESGFRFACFCTFSPISWESCSESSISSVGMQNVWKQAYLKAADIALLVDLSDLSIASPITTDSTKLPSSV